MSEQNVIHSKAVQDFLAEAEEIVEQLGSELADLSDMVEDGELDPDVLNSIFRGAHSLKGLAGMFNFAGVAELAHNMENLLDGLRLGKQALTHRPVAVLFDAHELLRSLIHDLALGSLTERGSDIAACVTQINSCLAPAGPESAASPLAQLGLPTHILDALTEYEEHRLKENVAKGRSIYTVHASFDLTTFDTELTALTDILKTRGEVVSTLPSVGDAIETNIDFDLLYGASCGRDELQTIIAQDSITVTQYGSASTVIPENSVPDAQLSQTLHESSLSSGTVAPPDDPVAPSPSGDAELSAKSLSRTVRVDIGKLDELMNIVGELVLAHSAIVEVALDMRGEASPRIAGELNKAAKVLERKLTDLQKGVMEIRMIPIGQLYEKMARIVRKISREQDKKVELKFFGADTELDKLIVEDISDPMMHIIRNAIDHGVESRETRIAQGKPEKGIIRISSYQKGNHVVIEIADDGAGIDVEKVKRKALQNGLVHEISAVSERDALGFIFLPGFSTSDSVSEVSGRGVGMDVVANNISAISGTVDVETKYGEGTRFTITLPITLAIIKALVIRCCGRIYALPVTSVLESLIVTDGDIMTIERFEVIHLRETTLPLLRLDQYFNLQRTGTTPKEQYVVVAGVADKRLGIIVDDLVCQQDIVIKPLGDQFRRFRGVSGAADLGDQRTILVLDVGGIISETVRSGS